MTQKLFIQLSVFVYFCWSGGLSLTAQQKVQSFAYNAMLHTLLSHSVDEVGVQDVQNKLNDGDRLVFLDARSRVEYNISHIKNAKWVGYENFSLDSMDGVSKKDEIVVYCSVGARSEEIALKLRNEGYENISNLYGGIFEWVNRLKPIYNEEGETRKIHAYSKTWGIWLTKGEKVY